MVYGTSIKLNNNFDFEFNATSKQLNLSTDTTNLSQAISILLQTHIGENKFYPTYGTDLKSIIGTNVPTHYIEYVIEKALIRDPRIASITSIIATKRGSQMSVDIKFVSNENATVDLRGIIIW